MKEQKRVDPLEEWENNVVRIIKQNARSWSPVQCLTQEQFMKIYEELREKIHD